mgnify:CR=1 FL=1
MGRHSGTGLLEKGIAGGFDQPGVIAGVKQSAKRLRSRPPHAPGSGTRAIHSLLAAVGQTPAPGGEGQAG